MRSPATRDAGQPPAPFGPALLLHLAWVALLAIQGCQLVGSAGPDSAFENAEASSTATVPEGRFTGFLEIEGGRMEGVLILTPTGGLAFDVLFESPPDLVASGAGRLREQWVRLELSYEGSCPGRMRLDGRWEEANGTLSGSVDASDCTGEAEGTFLFLR